MIQKEDYLRAKEIVLAYEAEQKKLSKISGESKCPFCGGTKTLPLMPSNMGKQDCKDCDTNGMISNRKLVTMGLEDFIEKV